MKEGIAVDSKGTNIIEDAFSFEKIADHHYRMNFYVLDTSELVKASKTYRDELVEGINIPMRQSFRHNYFNMKKEHPVLAKEISFEVRNEGGKYKILYEKTNIMQVKIICKNYFDNKGFSSLLKKDQGLDSFAAFAYKAANSIIPGSRIRFGKAAIVESFVMLSNHAFAELSKANKIPALYKFEKQTNGGTGLRYSAEPRIDSAMKVLYAQFNKPLYSMASAINHLYYDARNDSDIKLQAMEVTEQKLNQMLSDVNSVVQVKYIKDGRKYELDFVRFLDDFKSCRFLMDNSSKDIQELGASLYEKIASNEIRVKDFCGLLYGLNFMPPAAGNNKMMQVAKTPAIVNGNRYLALSVLESVPEVVPDKIHDFQATIIYNNRASPEKNLSLANYQGYIKGSLTTITGEVYKITDVESNFSKIALDAIKWVHALEDNARQNVIEQNNKIHQLEYNENPVSSGKISFTNRLELLERDFGGYETKWKKKNQNYFQEKKDIMTLARDNNWEIKETYYSNNKGKSYLRVEIKGRDMNLYRSCELHNANLFKLDRVVYSDLEKDIKKYSRIAEGQDSIPETSMGQQKTPSTFIAGLFLDKLSKAFRTKH